MYNNKMSYICKALNTTTALAENFRGYNVIDTDNASEYLDLDIVGSCGISTYSI